MCGHEPVWGVGIQIQYGGKYSFLCLCKGIEKLGEIVGGILRILRTKTVCPDFIVEAKPAQIYIGIGIWAPGIGDKFKTDVVTIREFLFQKIYVVHVS